MAGLLQLLKKSFLQILCALSSTRAQRYMGSFILTPFVKYKDFNENARKHMISTWHKGAAHDANTFLTIAQRPELNIVSQTDRAVNETVIRNREKLLPVLSTILSCGSHDILLYDLLCFRIEAGDAVLKDHFEGGNKNARYTSVRVRNELITFSEEVVRDNIVKAANESYGFSIIADETADIAGPDQLSIGVRFVELQQE